MRRSVWNDIVSGRLSNSTKYLSTPCIDDHHFKEEEEGLKSAGDLSKVCSQIVLRCLYLARIGRPDIRWSVKNLLDRFRNGPKPVTNDYLV